MKKRSIVIEIIIMYCIALGITALPLLLKLFVTNEYAAILGKMIIYAFMLMIFIIACRIKQKNTYEYLGYKKGNILKQITFSFVPFIIVFTLLVLLPLLFGVNKNMLLPAKCTDSYQIILSIIFYMVFVGPVEEMIFRGYFYEKLCEIIPNKIWIYIINALLFGFWHFPSSLSLTRVLCTTVIGFVYVISKDKIKNCSTLSLGIAHGLHDSVLLIMSSIL